MSMTDPIADLLTRIRNAQRVKKSFVSIPCSSKKVAILKVLKEEGYIINYKVNINESEIKAILDIELKYFQGQPVIEEIKRISKPGLRVYSDKNNIPKIMEGLGVSIVSTSHGVISDRKARKLGVGGEIICSVV